MKTYIVHYDKLIDRKKFMTYQMGINDLQCEYISNHPKDTLTLQDKIRFRNITDAEISVALHHIECITKIANGEDNYALILEDDVILCKNFKNILEKYLLDLPNNWDMLFIGDGCNLHIPKNELKDNVNIYLKSNFPSAECGLGATRCLDSYLITKNCAKTIVEKLCLLNYTICCPVDHLLNHVIINNKFNVYWSEPTIVTQGSQKNMYISSIR